MKLFDRIAMWQLRRRAKATLGDESYFLDEAFLRTFGDWLKLGYPVQEYIGAVFNCIDVWGLYFAKAKFRIYRETTQGREEVLDTSYNNIFKKPNSYQTWWEQKYKIAGHFGLFGNSYFYKLRNKLNGEVFGLQQLMPKNVRRVSTAEKVIDHYVFIAGDKEFKIAPDDIIDLRYPDPKSEIDGVAIAETVLDTTKLNYLQNQYMLKFLENGGFLGQVFTTKSSLKEKEWRDLMDRLEKDYAGAKNAGKMFVADNDMQPVKTAYSPKDIDMGSLKKLSRDDIYEAWKVSRIHVGSGELANRASNDASIYQFTSGVIDPVLSYVDAVFSEAVRMDLKDENLFIKHDTLAPKDAEQERLIYEFLIKNALMSISEIRHEYNLNYIPGKLVDKLLINGGGAIYDAISGERIGLPGEQAGDNGANGEEGKEPTDEPKSYKNDTTEAYKKLRWKQFDRQRLTAERRFNREILGYVDSQERRIVEALQDNYIVGEIFNIADEDWLLYQLLEIEIYTIFVEGAKWGSRLYSVDPPSFDELKQTLSLTFDSMYQNATIMNKTTLDILSKKEPEDIEEARGIVRSTFDDLRKSRSTALVRSTTLGAMNAGLLETMKLAGIEKKMWLSMRDDRVRQKLGGEDHREPDSVELPLDSLFEVKSRSGVDLMLYPGDPLASPENIINCRCTIIGV